MFSYEQFYYQNIALSQVFDVSYITILYQRFSLIVFKFYPILIIFLYFVGFGFLRSCGINFSPSTLVINCQVFSLLVAQYDLIIIVTKHKNNYQIIIFLLISLNPSSHYLF